MLILIDEKAALDSLLFSKTISYLVTISGDTYICLLSKKKPKDSPYPLVEQRERVN